MNSTIPSEIFPSREGDGADPKIDAKDRLVEVIQDLSLARDLNTVMGIVSQAGRQLTGADGASFILRDEDCCYYADEDAIAPLWKGKRFPMTICISGWCMRNRQSVVIENIYSDSRVPAEVYRPTFVRSLAMVPIRLAAPIGAIGAYWAKERRATAGELKLLQALADSASIAMENARLYHELERKTLAAQEANEMKSQFLSTVSHELRTPLNAIIGSTDLLVEGTYGPIPEAHQVPLARVQRNARDLLRLIEDALDFARIESGKLKVRLEWINLSRLIHDLLLDLGPLMEHRKLSIRVDVPDNLLPIESDAGKIRQILTNLLFNAVKFTHTGGITLSARACRGRNGVEISVADTGIGIPKEALSKIFDRFYQVDGTDTREFGGIGLGLTIVRQLVDLLGGEIGVQSTLGRGSTFTIFLPYTSSKKRGEQR